MLRLSTCTYRSQALNRRNVCRPRICKNPTQTPPARSALLSPACGSTSSPAGRGCQYASLLHHVLRCHVELEYVTSAQLAPCSCITAAFCTELASSPPSKASHALLHAHRWAGCRCCVANVTVCPRLHEMRQKLCCRTAHSAGFLLSQVLQSQVSWDPGRRPAASAAAARVPATRLPSACARCCQAGCATCSQQLRWISSVTCHRWLPPGR